MAVVKEAETSTMAAASRDDRNETILNVCEVLSWPEPSKCCLPQLRC